MKIKLLRSTLVAVIALLLISGCSDKAKAPSDDPDSSSVSSVTDGTADTSNENAPVTLSLEEVEEIKSVYIPSAEDAEMLKNEKTPTPIMYSGFKSYYFDTPALTEDLPIVSVTPLFSHAGLHNYIEQNLESYDLGEGEGSFEAFAESYMDSFFDGKGVLVISFADSEGGSGYSVTGAWEDVLEIDSMELKRLVLAVKKTEGSATAGHFIVEIDTNFISLWDNITISLYE